MDGKIANRSLLIQGPDCNFPSDCEETLYSQEMSQAKIKTNNRFIKRLHHEGQFLFNLTEQIKNETKAKKKIKLATLYKNIIDTSSIVHIYFKELGIVKYQKDQLYGPLDVIGMLFILNDLITNKIYIYNSCIWRFGWPLYRIQYSICSRNCLLVYIEALFRSF